MATLSVTNLATDAAAIYAAYRAKTANYSDSELINWLIAIGVFIVVKGLIHAVVGAPGVLPTFQFVA